MEVETWAQTGQYIGAWFAVLIQVLAVVGLLYLVVRVLRKRSGGSK